MQAQSVPTNMVRDRSGRLHPRPTWAADAAREMRAGHDMFSSTEFGAPPPREEIDAEKIRVVVVYSGTDVIFQLHPKSSAFPADQETARTLLAEAIEAHFGTTSGFQGGYTAELDSWGLKATGLSATAAFNTEYHINGFVQLLSDALAELEEE